MVYSKEIVREWLDEVAERAKEHPEWVDVFERLLHRHFRQYS